MIALVGVLLAGAVAVWFVGRARLGARARRTGGVRLRIVDRVIAAADAPLIRRMLVGAATCVIVVGWIWGIAGAAAGWGSWAATQRRRVARERDRLDEQIPDAMRAIAAGMRAGGSIALAIGAAGEEMPAPLGAHLARCAARCEVGMHLDDALERWAAEAGTLACRRLVETLRIGAVAGASLPRILDGAATSHEEWARLARDRRAASSQVRLSAIVVAAMPVAFHLLAGPAARGAAQVLVREPLGWALLATGLGLDAVGWAWMRRVAQGAG